MTKKSVGMAILAAGKGTRMKWEGPKALAPLLGKSLIDFSILALEGFKQNFSEASTIGVVTGHLREQVEGYVQKNYPQSKIKYALQAEQLGTGHALQCYFSGITEAKNLDYTLVMCADTPLIETSDLNLMFEEFKNNPSLDAVCATFKTQTPQGYGRIIRAKSGFHIVEEKDATLKEKQVQEVNSGLYIFKTNFLIQHLSSLKSNNKASEFYLTDLFQDHFQVKPLEFTNHEKFLGVNNLEQLEYVSKILRRRKIKNLIQNGVIFFDSEKVQIDWDVEIESFCTIHSDVYFYGKTHIGPNCEIEPGSVIKNSKLFKGVEIKAHSYLEDAIIREDATIGPFARVRPGSDVGAESKIGNFVELKKAVLEKGVKISHLSYVGDAFVGEETNIGCGFITCNYDGANKHVTKIGKGSFIGSDCQAVAPISIGDNSFVAAGTTITKDVPNDGFAIARSPIAVKEGMAKKFIKKKA